VTIALDILPANKRLLKADLSAMGTIMATQDQKVISFEAVQAKQKEGQRPAVGRIVADIRAIYSHHLGNLLQRLFTVIDDELFKRSDKAESVAMQTAFFEAMRQIRVEASVLQANYQLEVARQFDDFWKRKAPYPVADSAGPGGIPGSDSFALVEHEALEEQIAITTMVEKGNNLFSRDIQALNARFAVLLDREELESTDNPLGPYLLCNAFASTLKPLSLEMAIRLLVYKLFDKAVLSALGKMYHEVNALLVNEGILPNLTRVHKRPAGQSAPGGAGDFSDEDLDENQQAYLDVFHGMQRLMDSWRVQVGLPPAFEGYPMGSAFETTDVVDALSGLQHPGVLAASAMMNAEGLKGFLTDQLKTKVPDGAARPLGRAEEDIIDMVALIFDFILEDRNLPEPVKVLIARLQIPVVKVAILEKAFFGRKNHPVRLLLNALAQAGIGLDVMEGLTEMPVFKKIETVVTRILDEFDQNVHLFSELLDEFMAFMDKEAQRSKIAEERTRQVTQSKEQLHLAKRKIAYEIATRLEGKTAPAAVRSFLYNTWKDVLVLAYLRRDKQPGDWENALEIMDKLIWSVLPALDGATRKAIIQTIPRLLKSIRAGLESISLDPQAVSAALKELETCHIACLSQSSADAGAVGHPADTRKVEIRDPELAQAINAIRANLPDIENLTIDDLGKSPTEIGLNAGLEGDFIIEDEFLLKTRELQVGEWIEFEEGRKKIRGKLSWKSQVTSTYVFVNRKGAKVLEIALADLAKKLSTGAARVIEEAGVPLMDRAFNSLLNKLKSPAGMKEGQQQQQPA
jgi:hypothetical protein